MALGESLRRRLPPPVHTTLLPRLLEAALPTIPSIDITSTASGEQPPPPVAFDATSPLSRLVCVAGIPSGFSFQALLPHLNQPLSLTPTLTLPPADASATSPPPTGAAAEVTQAERAALTPLLPPAPMASETALWCRTGGVRGGGALLHRLHVDVCRDHVRVASAIQTPE